MPNKRIQKKLLKAMTDAIIVCMACNCTEEYIIEYTKSFVPSIGRNEIKMFLQNNLTTLTEEADIERKKIHE